MPNRILKESIHRSSTIDALDAAEEVCFYRLLVACDDYGRFDARPQIIRGTCFPLRLDSISDEDVRFWLSRLQDVGLLMLYVVKGLPYLQVTTWERHQQVRAKRSKFPSPDSSDIASAETCKQMLAPDSTCPRNPDPYPDPYPDPNHVVASDEAIQEVQVDEPLFEAGDEPYELAVELRGQVLGMDPKAKVPNTTPRAMRNWSRDFDRLIRVDERPPEEVRRVLAWIKRDSFWPRVILSPGSFRKNYTKCLLAMNASPRGSPNGRAAHPIREIAAGEEAGIARLEAHYKHN